MKVKALIASASFALALLSVGVPSGGSATPAPGAKLWAKRYTFSGSKTDSGNDVVTSPDGTKVFVAGSSEGDTTGYDYLTIAYDTATGAQSWAKRFNGPGNGADYSGDIALSPDGSKVFVTGESYASATRLTNYTTIAYDAATGAQLWVARYNGPASGADEADALAVSPDGTKVFVTGDSYGGTATSSDYATLAYDASKGTQLWVQRYNGPANGIDDAEAIALSGDGTKVFVTGDGAGLTTYSNYTTIAYSASTGAQLWLKKYDGPARKYDRSRAIAVGSTGTVFVTGDSEGKGVGEDYATIAYDPTTGAELWTSRLDGPWNNDDIAYALAVSGDGKKVFVTGSIGAGELPDNDYGTVAYDAATGSKLWSKQYDGPGSGYDGAYAIAVDPTGAKVFVTGDSYGGPTTSYDGATLAYDTSTGTRLWRVRYNGPGSDYDGFYGLAVSPSARVFVTGSGYGGATSGNDAATVTYEG